MSDRAALYAAVCANPDDDTVRLVMADWFDENAQAKRANFIRARVAHDRGGEADTPAAAFYRSIRYESGMGLDRVDWAACDPEVAALVAAERDTTRRTFPVTTKSEGVPRLKGVSFYGHVRGFLFGIDVRDGETFAEHAAAVFRAAPITDVRFEELTADGARAVAASGFLGRIRNLAVLSAEEPEALRVIGRDRDAAGVRGLEIGSVGEEPAAVRAVLDAIAGGPHWTGLRDFELTDAYLDSARSPAIDAAFAALLREKPFRGLETIVAYGNGVGIETARAVAEAKLTELRHLDLGMNSVTTAGAEAIAASKHLGALRHLDLSSNTIQTGRGAGALIASPNLSGLTVLKLSSNQFSGLGPKALPANPRGPTLRSLDLDGCNLWPSGAERLFRCPSVRGLWRLDLGHCDLDDAAMVALAASGMDRLAALCLRGNAITARGLKTLAGSELAARLQWLNLAEVKMTAADAAALTDGTNVTNLKCLLAGGRGRARLRKHFGAKVVVSA